MRFSSGLWALGFLGLFAACQGNLDQPDGSLVYPNQGLEDSLELPLPPSDSLGLQPGQVPKGWHRLELGGEQGFYAAFPRKPKEVKHPKERRLEWRFQQSKYSMSLSIGDLSEQAAFQAHGNDRQAFYQAVLRDLMKDLQLDALPMELNETEQFYWLDVYEATRALIRAKDFKLYTQMVVVGQDFFVLNFLLWDEEGPSLAQVRKQFFNAFSKEGYLPKSQRNDSLALPQ